MRQIENFHLGEICICISTLETIRLLPGINLIDDNSYLKLSRHPGFNDYLYKGVLLEIHIDENEITVDEDTKITILQTDYEKVPIQNVIVNNVSKPIAQNGVIISRTQAKQAGLSQDIANRLNQYMPPGGWISAQQIREKLDLSYDHDLSKLPFPDVE